MIVETDVVKIPILRPLIALNKPEIIDISREINMYDLSVGVTCDCNATPKKPATHAELDKVLEVEKEAKVDKIAKKALSKGLETEIITY